MAKTAKKSYKKDPAKNASEKAIKEALEHAKKVNKHNDALVAEAKRKKTLREQLKKEKAKGKK